jgi:hypothetical protein
MKYMHDSTIKLLPKRYVVMRSELDAVEKSGKKRRLYYAMRLCGATAFVAGLFCMVITEPKGNINYLALWAAFGALVAGEGGSWGTWTRYCLGSMTQVWARLDRTKARLGLCGKGTGRNSRNKTIDRRSAVMI